MAGYIHDRAAFFRTPKCMNSPNKILTFFTNCIQKRINCVIVIMTTALQ